MHKIVKITTVPMSLKHLLRGQMLFMKKNGFKVYMVSADGPEIEDISTFEQCDHIEIPLTRQITPFQDIVCIIKLIILLRRIKPTIVHSHTPKAGLIGMIAAWISRVPLRIHTVGGLPLHTAIGGKKKLLVFIEKITYFFATNVWPNSYSLFNYIKDNKFTNSNKLHVIGKGTSNGIDIEEFSKVNLDEAIINEIKSKIDYDKSNFYLMFVGRVVKDKGIEELIQAFVELQNHHLKIKLVLVGPLEEELDPLSRETLSIIENNHSIIKIGYTDKVKYYLSLANLFVFPSHREGFPNVPMQAALMDVPVVASRITGNIDIIDDKINGYLHVPKDVQDLFLKLDFAIKNYDNSKLMAELLKIKIVQNFSRSNIHEIILNKYIDLIKINKL